MSEDEDFLLAKPPELWKGDYIVTAAYLKGGAEEGEQYERKRDAEGLFTLIVSPEPTRSPDTQRAFFAGYEETTRRGLGDDDLNAEMVRLEKEFPEDVIEWCIYLKIPKATLEIVDHVSDRDLSKKERIQNRWRNADGGISAQLIHSDKEGFMEVNARFKEESGARSFAYEVAKVLNYGRPAKITKRVVPGEKEASKAAFVVWLREKMKGEPGDLWSPAPNAGGSWVYGSTVTKFNEETGSTLSFMALCSALDRKPQVKDGKKRVLILTEVS